MSVTGPVGTTSVGPYPNFDRVQTIFCFSTPTFTSPRESQPPASKGAHPPPHNKWSQPTEAVPSQPIPDVRGPDSTSPRVHCAHGCSGEQTSVALELNGMYPGRRREPGRWMKAASISKRTSLTPPIAPTRTTHRSDTPHPSAPTRTTRPSTNHLPLRYVPAAPARRLSLT